MLTKKGNSYRVLLNMELSDRLLTVHIPVQGNLLGEITPEYIATAIPLISERIQTEKKPAGVLEKELHRIELHRDQLRDAYMSLWQSYAYILSPPTRVKIAEKVTEAADTAKEAMLSAMPDKMLREFCSIYLGDKAQEFVLPDDREQIINMTVIVMKEVE